MDFQDMIAKVKVWFNETIDTIKALPTDEKVSYGSIIFGTFLLVAAAIIW
jgi:hypothetical protein